MEKLCNSIVNGILNGDGSGGTFKIDGTKVHAINGYFVSLKRGFVIPTPMVLNLKYPNVTLSYAMEKLFSLNGDAQFDYIGYWVSGGIAYIDCTVHIRTKKKALKIGRLNNQIAVWDCKNNVSINL